MQRTLALILATATLLAGCGKPKPQAQKLLTVKTARIAEADFQPSIEAISMLESTTTVSLRPETDGRVVPARRQLLGHGEDGEPDVDPGEGEGQAEDCGSAIRAALQRAEESILIGGHDLRRKWLCVRERD